MGKEDSDFQDFLMNKFHSAHLSEINIEFNKQERDLDSDANGCLEINTCYIFSYAIIRQHNKESIRLQVPLHKYLGLLRK